MIWEFIQRIFCGTILSQLEIYKKEVKRLREEVKILETEKVNLKMRIGELEARVDNLNDELKKLREENEELKEDVEYYKNRVKTLLKALSEAIGIPDISGLVTTREVVRPYQLSVFKDYDMLAADPEYYAFSYDNWIVILTQIWEELKETIKGYRRAVFDCDDFALTLSALLAIAIEEVELDLQAAFTIIWSYTHAYNAFIDIDGNIWIYEPQANKVVGKLGETDKPYNSKFIWFPGERHGTG